MSKWVELEEHVGINLVSKKPQKHEQWFVNYCNDDSGETESQRVGLIGWKEGSKIAFFVRIDPLTRAFIEEEVAELLQRENPVSSSMVPEDLPEQTEGDYDEFDEEDFTI